MAKPTVALQMIFKDELADATRILVDAYPYFDELNFTVSDRKTAESLMQISRKQPKLHVQYRKWNNRFDEARNDNLKMNNCDFWFWMDADDEFPFDKIPLLLQVIEEGQFDQLLLGYNYAQDEHGECVSFHWRERLFRSSHPFVWKGWVHETPITDLPYKPHRVSGVVVVHKSDEDHNVESMYRNHKILEEATKVSDDPRYQLYLGTSHFALGEYGEALQILDKFVKVSGNMEDVYRALCVMSECSARMKELNVAIKFALQAIATIPDFVQAYLLIAQWEMEQKNFAEAVEWCRMADAKPIQQGLGVFNPTERYAVQLVAANCEFMQGNYNKALRWIRKLPEKHPARQEYEAEFLSAADVETFVAMLPKFRRYFESEEKLYHALNYDLRYDTRLRGLRELVEKPKTWEDNSIVFLCGEGYEEWGPHTLGQGMGGSEEAVVYLCRELAKLGWKVTVYGAVEEPLFDTGFGKDSNTFVAYKPWREINKKDNFNVFVAWRAPEFSEHINAKVKIADIHDLLRPAQIKNYPDVTYFVKSNFHRNEYKHLPDEKFRVIGNGILKEQFREDS